MNLLIGRTQTALLQITDDFEIILVDDGSSDNSVAVIEQIIQQHKKIKCVVLDKNYGQHTAIKAGLDNCSGTWVVVMDCDLQDQPEAIIELMKKANGKRARQLLTLKHPTLQQRCIQPALPVGGHLCQDRGLT